VVQLKKDRSREEQIPEARPRHHLRLLLVVLVVASAIRLYGINHDLPFVYDQDEPMFVGRALSMLKNHDPNPHWFGPPAGPTMYLLAALYGSMFVIGRILGIFHTPEDFRILYYSNATVFYLSGRVVVSAIFGIATVWLLYHIGRRLFDPKTGLFAASVLAVSAIHVALSQMVRMDVQMSFLLLVAFWYCLEILEKKNWSSYLLAGFFTGLATVTKYPAVVFTLTIALTHFLLNHSYRLLDHKKLVGAAVATVAGAFIGAPFVFLDFRTMLHDVAREARPEHLGATGEGFFLNFLWYFRGPLPTALSLAGLALALTGLAFCIFSRHKERWVLVSFPLAFLLFISGLNLRWERWILPALPFLCLLLAAGAMQLIRYVSTRAGHRAAIAGAALVISVVLGPLGYRSLAYARALSAPYTSTVARQWMIKNLPRDSRVLIEVYSPTLPSGLFQVFAVNEQGNLQQAQSAYGDVGPEWEIGRMRDTTDLEKFKIQYVVFSNRDRYIAESNRYAREVEIYERVVKSGALIFQCDGSGGLSRGPRIQIFQMSIR
jgi:4-amino-4-deoxy-L-arabinose transferase-like glycosyltransferase